MPSSDVPRRASNRAPWHDPPERQFEVSDEPGVVRARFVALTMAEAAGLSPDETQALGIAVAEIARNAVIHAHGGRITARCLRSGRRLGVEVVVSDDGPGMDVALSMRDGYSTAGGLGNGLPGARRMVSEFEVDSERGRGTLVRLVKWPARRSSAAPQR